MIFYASYYNVKIEWSTIKHWLHVHAFAAPSLHQKHWFIINLFTTSSIMMLLKNDVDAKTNLCYESFQSGIYLIVLVESHGSMLRSFLCTYPWHCSPNNSNKRNNFSLQNKQLFYILAQESLAVGTLGGRRQECLHTVAPPGLASRAINPLRSSISHLCQNQTNPFLNVIYPDPRPLKFSPKAPPPLLDGKSESEESNSRLVLSHEVGKLSVLGVELDDAYPVLDFLRRNVATVGKECGVAMARPTADWLFIREQIILYVRKWINR